MKQKISEFSLLVPVIFIILSSIIIWYFIPMDNILAKYMLGLYVLVGASIYMQFHFNEKYIYKNFFDDKTIKEKIFQLRLTAISLTAIIFSIGIAIASFLLKNK